MTVIADAPWMPSGRGLASGQREEAIAAARQRLVERGEPPTMLAPWVDASWRRCLDRGMSPGTPVSFDVVTATRMRAVRERAQALTAAAEPVIAGLRRTMQSTGYFAILTDRDGVVVAVDGPIDRTDRRADVIARVGVDLSEERVGTTAIGTALAESRPVWLHRGEHFFDDTAVYSCAGAPIHDGLGRLAGMLDLTGIMAVERPALRHLVASAARAIETRAVLGRPHAIALAIDWPELAVSGSPRGWLVADAEGFVTGVSREACDMLGLAPAMGEGHTHGAHLADIFAMKWQRLFDLAGRRGAIELPLWSGLMIRAEVHPPGGARPTTLPEEATGQPLKALEADLIRRTVRELRGNVKAAAERLGISRATIYRKLGKRPPEDGR